jgi:effector-binding domain-containing protein
MPEFEFRETAEQHTAVIRMTRPMMHIGAAMAEAFPKIYHAVVSAGMEPAGEPLARYFEMIDGVATFECAIPVPQPIAPSGEVQPNTIGGGEVAFTVHVGPYQRLADTWDALTAWVTEQGRTPTALGWEVYLDDPGEVGEDALRTEVYMPLE